MQTPISFALDILLDCDTIEKAHKMARRYVKVLEACGNPPVMRNAPNTQFPAMVNPITGPTAQAPSTQRLLEQHGIAQSPAPLIAAPARLMNAEIDKETGRAMISTGGGTKGPRKF